MSIFENPVVAHQISDYDPEEPLKKYSIDLLDPNQQTSLGKFTFAVKVTSLIQ